MLGINFLLFDRSTTLAQTIASCIDHLNPTCRPLKPDASEHGSVTLALVGLVSTAKKRAPRARFSGHDCRHSRVSRAKLAANVVKWNLRPKID